jgi:hypothetical protein
MNPSSPSPSPSPIKRSPRALLCVTIDCERDKGPGWKIRRPATYAGIHEGIVRRLQPLFTTFGVRPTYLLSPEVMRDDASAQRLATLPGSYELGTHLHAEYVAPDLDDDAESEIFQASLSPAIERAKMQALTSLFVERFGCRPRAFRAGRFGIGAASLPILADLGYHVDSSVTPLLDWRATGKGGPCFRDAPFVPYRPDPAAPAHPGNSPLWEVPLTIRAGAWQRVPVWGRTLPHRWLRPTWASARQLVRLARQVLAEPATTGPALLNVMFHNVEVTAGASPYAASAAAADALVDRLAGLLAFTRDAGVVSVGLSEVPEFFA